MHTTHRPKPTRRWLASAAAAILLVGCGDDSSTDPEPSGPASSRTTFIAAADATVRASFPDEPDGTTGVLEVRDGVETYLRFDLSGLPEEAVISSATLRLVAFSGTGGGDLLVLYVPNDTWEEETLTDNNKPNSTGEPLGALTLPASVSGDAVIELTSDLLSTDAQHESFGLNRILSLKVISFGDVAEMHSREASIGVRPRLEVTFRTGTTAIMEPVADSWVSLGSPTTNFGSDTTFQVDRGNQRAFLRFDLGMVPANAIVGGVALTAHTYAGYAWGGDGNVYTRFVPDDSWTETGLTWDNQPDAEDTYRGHWWLWYDATPSEKTGRNVATQLVPVLQDEVSGDRMLSIRLHSPGYRTNYHSRELEDGSRRPTLEILYVMP